MSKSAAARTGGETTQCKAILLHGPGAAFPGQSPAQLPRRRSSVRPSAWHSGISHGRAARQPLHPLSRRRATVGFGRPVGKASVPSPARATHTTSFHRLMASAWQLCAALQQPAFRAARSTDPGFSPAANWPYSAGSGLAATPHLFMPFLHFPLAVLLDLCGLQS